LVEKATTVDEGGWVHGSFGSQAVLEAGGCFV
jgi:hypothetical protein